MRALGIPRHSKKGRIGIMIGALPWMEKINANEKNRGHELLKKFSDDIKQHMAFQKGQ